MRRYVYDALVGLLGAGLLVMLLHLYTDHLVVDRVRVILQQQDSAKPVATPSPEVSK